MKASVGDSFDAIAKTNPLFRQKQTLCSEGIVSGNMRKARQQRCNARLQKPQQWCPTPHRMFAHVSETNEKFSTCDQKGHVTYVRGLWKKTKSGILWLQGFFFEID